MEGLPSTPGDAAPEGWDAFLSYSHRDSAAAERVHAFLQEFPLPPHAGQARRRLRIFRDRSDLRARNLGDELPGEIASAAILLVCCSSSASASGWVTREIEAYLTKRGDKAQIIPLLLSGETENALPEPLKSREPLVLDLRDGWQLGRPRSSTRLELLRAIAGIADIPLRELIPWDQARRRQRLAMAAGAGLAVTAALIALGVSLLLERRGAEALASHRQAEGALVQLATGDVPHAVAALGRVIGNSGEEFARDYGDVFRFWLARLSPLDRVVANAQGALLRKGGRNHLVLGAQSMPIVAADEPFEAVRVGADHLLVVAPGEVLLLALPDMRPVLRQAFPTRLTFEAFASAADGRVVVAAASQLETTNDEDKPTIVHPCHILVVAPGATSPTVGTPSSEAVRPAASGRLAMVLRQKDEAGWLLASSCVVSREELDEPDSEKPRSDLPAAAQAFAKILPESGVDMVALQPLRPIARFDFPSLLGEARLWRHDASQSTPLAVSTAFNAALLARTMEALEKLADRESADWAPYFHDLEECAVACGAVPVEGGTIIWSVTVSGNSLVNVTQCEVRDAPPGARCQPNRVDFTTINAGHVFSPGGRWMLTISQHIGAAPLQLFDLIGYRHVPLGRMPAGKVVQAAFTSSPERLLVLTENDEVWVFERDASGWRLQRRIPIATLVGDSSDACHYYGTAANGRQLLDRPLLSLSPALALALNNDCTLLAIDPSTGNLRWRAPLGRPAADERIDLISAPGSAVIAVTIGARLRLFHAGTGAPLSDTIDITTLFAGAKPEDTRVSVTAAGEVRVTSTSAGTAIREAPPLERDFKALMPRLHSWTGISGTSSATLPEEADPAGSQRPR
ncbi:MAG: toll/interleukin-1 receptor domain-containing protein [Reyranella sp.]